MSGNKEDFIREKLYATIMESDKKHGIEAIETLLDEMPYCPFIKSLCLQDHCALYEPSECKCSVYMLSVYNRHKGGE